VHVAKPMCENPRPPDDAGPAKLRSVVQAFKALDTRLAATDSNHDTTTKKHETPPDQLLADILTDQQAALGWQAASQPAAGVADIVAKAHILSELTGADREDLGDQLAASLAADIIRLLSPAR